MSDMTVAKAQALVDGATPGPWMVAGVRGNLDGQPVHNVLRYDDERGRDEQIAAVWYDVKTGMGYADARLIAAAPDLARAYIAQAAELARPRAQVAAADKLAEAGQAMIDFHYGPVEAKRPDIWQRLLQRFADALSAYEEAGK